MKSRCDYRAGVGGIQCCQDKGHEGPHLFKCAGRHCPGLPWIASNTPHPTSCTINFKKENYHEPEL